MDILKPLNTKQLANSLKEAVAKSRNEIRCAEKDLKTAQSRLEFVMLVIDELHNRD